MNRGGYGLILFILVIAIIGILTAATGLLFANAGRELQLRIDDGKAYYLAQAGVMDCIQDWRVSNATDLNRRYDDQNITLTGNQLFKTGCQANFAYFYFNGGGTATAQWQNGSGSRRRLRRWNLRNIHVAEAGTADNIIVTQARVTWTPTNAAQLIDLRLNNVSVIPAGGPFANGTTLTLTGTAAQRTLTPGSTWTGNNTYLEWNINPSTPAAGVIQVRVQWTFADNSATKDSVSHAAEFWNAAQAGAAPVRRTFCVTSTGQVNQTVGAFKVMETVKATVSSISAAYTSQEIINWEKIDKNIP